MIDNLFKGSALRFAAVTILIWLISMTFVYVVGGRASINQSSALGSLAAPAIWLLSQVVRRMFKQ